MLKRVVRYFMDVFWNRGTHNDYAGCVLTGKSMTCAHLFHGVNLLKSWKVDVGYARSMVIVIAEDAGQCVLGMDSSSAKSISVSSDVIRSRTCRKAVNAVKVKSTTEEFRNVEDGMWRWTHSTVVKLRMSCRETLGAQFYESL